MTYFNGQLLRSDEEIKIDVSLSIFECQNHGNNGIEGKLLVDNNYYEFLFLIICEILMFIMQRKDIHAFFATINDSLQNKRNVLFCINKNHRSNKQDFKSHTDLLTRKSEKNILIFRLRIQKKMHSMKFNNKSKFFDI
jgi:hypothetical protein